MYQLVSVIVGSFKGFELLHEPLSFDKIAPLERTSSMTEGDLETGVAIEDIRSSFKSSEEDSRRQLHIRQGMTQAAKFQFGSFGAWLFLWAYQLVRQGR